MSYSRVFTFHSAEVSPPDAANLRALVLDAAGDSVVVDAGNFVDLDDGFFTVLIDDIPAVHQGSVRIYDNTAPAVTLDVQPINATDDPCHAVNSVCGSGVGSLAVTYCVKNAVTGDGIEDVTVEVYSDAARLTRVAVAVTDEDGNAALSLDPGTYYIFRYKVGVTFTDPHVYAVA